MELNLLIFLPSEPELSWQVALKKTKIKLNLLTDISLMVEKSIRSGMCYAIPWNVRANQRYVVKVNKLKSYWNVNNLYGWTMSQKLPVGSFKWVEETYQFNEDFIISCYKDSDEGYFLKVNMEYPKGIA